MRRGVQCQYQCQCRYCAGTDIATLGAEADAYVTFSLNPDGSIGRMKMAPVSTETDFSDDFADLTLVPVTAKKAEAQ